MSGTRLSCARTVSSSPGLGGRSEDRKVYGLGCGMEGIKSIC